MKPLLRLLFVLALSAHFQLRAAVSYSISPTSVGDNFQGTVNLQITGLDPGETIQVSHYFDVNANGSVDAADWLQDFCKVTDGVAAIFGGVTNLNVPHDANSASGAFTIPIDFSSRSFDQKYIGSHLLVVSSPTSHFSPITNLLTITNVAYGQKVSGTITSSGTAVPYASIILLAVNGGDSNPTIGVFADALGNYSIKAPVGNYVVAPFKTNYVTYFLTSPNVSLTNGANLTANPTLIPSTRTISGRIVDAADNTTGIGGLLLTASSDSGGFVLGSSDATGAFTLTVNSANWKLKDSGDPAAIRGYLIPGRLSINATTGNVANANIALIKESALIYGRITDEQNNPFQGARPWDQLSLNSQDYEGSAITDANGNFFLPATAGTFTIGFDAPVDPAHSGYLFPQDLSGITVTAGGKVQKNYVAIKATNTISGFLLDSNNQGISGIDIWANVTVNNVTYKSQATTTTNGAFTLIACNGQWTVGADCSSLQSCPASQFVTVNGNNPTVIISTSPCDNPPQIFTDTLPFATVQQYYSTPIENSGGNSLAWSISSGTLPPGLNLNPDGSISGTPSAAGTFFFTVRLSIAGCSSPAEQALSILVLPAGAGWSRKAFMPTGRVAPAAAAINGKMYVVGGFGNGQIFANLEAYDPSQGTWQTLAPMSVPRGRLAASALNGKLYVAGGYAGTLGDVAGTAFEVYSTATGQWQTLPSMGSARSGCASAIINNKLYVVGGTTDPIRSVEIYDLTTGTWSYGEPVPTSRFSPAAVAVNNKLYVIGGGTGGAQGALEVYDPLTDTWAAKAPFPDNSLIAAAAYDGKIFVAAGYSSGFASYDPATDQWSQLPNAPTARGDVAAVVIGDAFLVAGGTPQPGGVLLPTLEQFRTKSGDGIISTILKSDTSVTAAGIGFGVPSISKFDRLNAATTTNLIFTPALTTNSVAFLYPPDGSPSDAQLITIPPGDGENGFFKTKFTLPSAYSGVQLSFAISADDMSRIFLNGNAVTPAMVQGENYQNIFFSVLNPSLFHPGDNEVLIANANYFGGASGIAFYGIVTYRPNASLTALNRVGNQFQLSASIEALKTYSFEWTQDFQTWNTLVTTSSPNASITITDPNATNKFRAYRVNSQ